MFRIDPRPYQAAVDGNRLDTCDDLGLYEAGHFIYKAGRRAD
jgi:hypothetical protein